MIGVLLINLGTPDSPATQDVRKYLSEFLNDPRVIDIHPVSRFFLVNGIIVPFRAPKSAKLYKEIWTERGSPLLFHTKDLTEKLQTQLGKDYIVDYAMRYQKPSIKEAINRLYSKSLTKLIVIPLYPQYALSSTGSTIEKFFDEIKTWPTFPDFKIINSFYNHPEFLNAWVEIGKKYNHQEYDHVLFSFHGLPERQINKCDNSGKKCFTNGCCDKIDELNHQCYRASCFETARQIANGLQINHEKYSVSFQSRLGKDPWIKPYSDFEIKRLAGEGKKKILVFSPAFVADCLETLHEIGTEYNELFLEHGGEKIQLVESLNSNDSWVNALKSLILEK